MKTKSIEQKIDNHTSSNQNIETLKYIGQLLLETNVAGLTTYLLTNNINNSIFVGMGYGIFRTGFDAIDCIYSKRGRMYKITNPTNHNQQ